MRRWALLLFAVGMLAMPAMSQEPSEAYRAEIKALGEDMKAVSREGHRDRFRSLLVDRGFPTDRVDAYVERVQELFGDRPIVIKRRPYGSVDYSEVDRETGIALFEKVQELYRWQLSTKVNSRVEQFEQSQESGSIPLKIPCPGCIDIVMDCVNLIDALYFDCIDSGASLSFCSDLWLTSFDICEDAFEEHCEQNSC